MSEIDTFFQGLPSEDKKDADVFNDKPKEEQTVISEKKDEPIDEESEGKKNRRHRRLEEQLQRERESSIALNERVKVLSEALQFDRDVKQGALGDLDPDLVRVFGNTDQGKEVASIMQQKINDAVYLAEERALEKIEQRQQQAQQEQAQYESFIDSQLEALEDEYNVDLTSDAPAARKARTEFLTMVQDLSPKDEDGTITDYADFGSTFDMYTKTREDKSNNNSRQKEIAARSMQRSGQNVDSAVKITPGFHGWKQDYNLN